MFAGIANPWIIPEEYRRYRRNGNGETLYPDHYWYKKDDLNKIIKEASRLSADAIITTAKDAVQAACLDLYDKTGLKINF